MKNLVCCVIPNWNGKDSIGDAIESLQDQTQNNTIIVVENGSTDGSVEYIKQKYPNVTLLEEPKNLGFAGGVNVGIRYALSEEFEFIALFNNDAVADKEWLSNLIKAARSHPKAGMITCKFLDSKGDFFDSTGDIYTIWGLPHPRGRGEPVSAKYDSKNWVFAATGGASLYRATLFNEIGLFDEDFFAYYEDIDISFRGQLAGWKTYYQPAALAYHQIGATSGKIKGFTTYQSAKNLPMLFWKNVPYSLWPTVFPRLFFAYWMFIIRAITRGNGWAAITGHFRALCLLPKKMLQRHYIQKGRKISPKQVRSLLSPDLPPNAHNLRRLRSFYHKKTRGTK